MNPPREPPPAGIASLARQRDLAWVCAILAAIVTFAMGWDAFSRDWPEVRSSREALVAHRQMLAEHQKIMEAVNAALAANQQELARLRQSSR